MAAASPRRVAMAQALTSYYTLLTEFPYLPPSAIASPPAEGWGASHHVVFTRLGKSATVVDVLGLIPYLTTEQFELTYDTTPLDWRSFRIKQVLDVQIPAGPIDGGDAGDWVASLAHASLEPMLQTVPSNVICLTRASNYGRWLLLDVDAGTVTDYSVLGGPDPKATDEERATGIVWKLFETLQIAEILEGWSEKLRSLWWVPLPGPDGKSGTIRTPVSIYDTEEEAYRQIYRKHGWGTGCFRKEECRTALVAEEERQFQQLQDRYNSAKALAKPGRQREDPTLSKV